MKKELIEEYKYSQSLDNFRNLILDCLNLDTTKENNLRKLVILSIRKSDPANKEKDNSILLREIEKYDCHQTSLLAKKKTKLIIDIENALHVKLSDEDAVKSQDIESLNTLFINSLKTRKNEKPKSVRKDFPFFSETDLIYLDNAATTQKPEVVINTVCNFYKTNCSNINRGSYPLAVKTSEAFERARNTIASFINSDADKITFTKGTTESINIIARSLGEIKNINNKNIVISQMEHSSNRLPWENLCEKTGCELRIVPLTKEGNLKTEDFERLTDTSTILISVTGMSNINGFIPDLKAIVSIAKQNKTKVLIDAAQLIAHNTIDVKSIGCDFLCFSGHKIYGPQGTGVLYISEEGQNIVKPLLYGGGMLEKDGLYMEAGTQDIAGVLGLEKALSYLKEEFFIKEKNLSDIITEKLRSFPHLRVLASEHSPVISFASDTLSTDFMAKHLFNDSIALRTGSNCAPWMLERLGLDAVCRISLGIYTQESDVESFIKSMEVLNLKAHNFS